MPAPQDNGCQKDGKKTVVLVYTDSCLAYSSYQPGNCVALLVYIPTGMLHDMSCSVFKLMR